MFIESGMLFYKGIESEQLRQDVEAFLAKGGKIQKFALGETSQQVEPAAKLRKYPVIKNPKAKT